MQSSRPVRRADGARTLLANRSTKICRPHDTASHRKRRAMTTNSTLLADSGRSPTRRWYRLCTRRESVPQDGHAADTFSSQRRSCVEQTAGATGRHRKKAQRNIGALPKHLPRCEQVIEARDDGVPGLLRPPAQDRPGRQRSAGRATCLSRRL
jgi:hypothetical protein